MQPFVFWNPTEVVFGKNGVKKLGKLVKKYGGSKVLLVYGKGSIKKTGLYQQVLDSLKEAGIEWVEHSGVKPNPVLSHTREGVEKAKREKVDLVLAVGGGSVIDESKAIAAGALADCDVWEFFEFTQTIKAALPIVTVLTICGTGSEMNAGLVITNEEKKAKYGFRSPYLFPKVSVLDPTITFSVPKDQTAYGAVDAFSHVFEVYMNREDLNSPIPEGIMETLMRTIVERTPQAQENPEDYTARADLMWASSLALSGLTWCGVSAAPMLPCHAIEHALSAFYDIAHGAGLAIVMPAWMRLMKDEKAEEIKRFASRVFGVEGVDEGIEAFERWLKRVECPVRLSEASIPESDIPALAENGNRLAFHWGYKEYTKELIEKILRLAV